MNDSNRIWILTAIGVVLIIGGAVFIKKQRMASYVQPPAAPVIAMDTPTFDIPVYQPPSTPDAEPDMLAAPQSTLMLRVPAWKGDASRFPLEYTCFNKHISPQLVWQGAPEATQSFVVLLERRKVDEEPYLTWVLFNIPADYKGLDANLPKRPEPGDGMRHARSDANTVEYAGPCESRGKVPYAFRLFALDAVLDVPAGIAHEELAQAMTPHIIGSAEVPFTHYKQF